MADLELGSSGYPSELDTNPSPQTSSDLTGHLPVIGGIDACINIQTELGINPAQNKSTVLALLQTEHDTDGEHTFKYPVVFMQGDVPISQSAVALAVAGTSRELNGSVTWDPGSLADGAGETKSVTVTGVALGDFVVVAAPYDLQDMIATAYVQAADTVEIRLQNESGGVIDLASGTWKVKVISDAPVNAALVDEVCVPWAGSVTGISVFSNAARTAGTLTVDATINGTVTGLQAVLDVTNTTYHYASQAKDTDAVAAGDRVGVKITTDAGWLPITADIAVVVFISFNT